MMKVNQKEKISIDVNEFRRPYIQTMPAPGDKVKKHLYGIDEKLTIYYDETNNIRKLYLREDGPNDAEMNNFVLGGILHRTSRQLPVPDELRSLLRIQSSAPEIKFDLVAKGDYPVILDSKKLNVFLQYLVRNDIYIHFFNLNLLYWSLVDIVDSVLTEHSQYAGYNRLLKNELYACVSSDRFAFFELLYSFGYPNIDRNVTSEFIRQVLEFLDSRVACSTGLGGQVLRALIQEARYLPELTFLVDNEDHILIDGFHHFYVRPICIFKKSVHIFDEELTIQRKLAGFHFINGTKEVPVSFVDSKTSFGVQLSDVVSGFLGKHFSFVENQTPETLIAFRQSLSETQRKNLTLLEILIDKSLSISDALIYRTVPDDSELKYGTLTFS